MDSNWATPNQKGLGELHTQELGERILQRLESKAGKLFDWL